MKHLKYRGRPFKKCLLGSVAILMLLSGSQPFSSRAMALSLFSNLADATAQGSSSSALPPDGSTCGGIGVLNDCNGPQIPGQIPQNDYEAINNNWANWSDACVPEETSGSSGSASTTSAGGDPVAKFLQALSIHEGKDSGGNYTYGIIASGWGAFTQDYPPAAQYSYTNAPPQIKAAAAYIHALKLYNQFKQNDPVFWMAISWYQPIKTQAYPNENDASLNVVPGGDPNAPNVQTFASYGHQMSQAVQTGTIQPVPDYHPFPPTPLSSVQLPDYQSATDFQKYVQQAGGSPASSSNDSQSTNENVQTAYNFLVNKGLQPMQAAAIVGVMNSSEDSGLDPTKVEVGGGGGYGIAQWTPPTAMKAWVTANGEDPNSLPGQLDYLWWELNNSYTYVLSDLKATTSIQDAVEAWVGNSQPSAGQYLGHYLGRERPANEGKEIAQSIPAATQLFEQYNGGASGTSTGSTGCQSSLLSSATSGTGCQNPFRDIKNLRVERIDQGVDYGGSGNVYAVCSGTITHISGDGGWDYGGPPNPDAYIVIKIAGGQYDGLLSYMAEECTPQVKVGQQVTTSTIICTMDNASGSGIETGWAASPNDSQPIAQLYGGNGCCSTTAGVSYNNFLVSVGTPSGYLTNQPIGSPLPSPYPSSTPAPNTPSHP